MKWIFKQITTFLSVYYAFMVEYRAELFFWLLANSLPIILMGVWIEAAQGGRFGLEPLVFARYFIAVFLVRQFTVVWVIWDFEREIVEGRLSFRLLQPLDPIWHHVAGHVSERLARLPFVVIVIGLFFWLYPAAFWLPSWDAIALSGIAVTVAFAMRFMMQYTYAMFAFWTERANAIEQFSFLFSLFLSGMIAPLDVFPPEVRELALWTPFPYVIYFPAALLVGLKVNFWRSFAMTLGWMLVFVVLNRWLWRRGLKQYSGMGA